jgi:DNA polymerase-3 subunit delta'
MTRNLDDLLLHSRTLSQVKLLINNPPHAILITGPAGSGKLSVAKELAGSLLNTVNLDSYPYFSHVKKFKNKQDITIEQVREIIKSTNLKIPGSQKIQRVILIEDAHLLSVPAQNALLKILEEPNSGTVFLLSATSAHNVLPTIVSRTQRLEILPVGIAAAADYWSGQYSPEQLKTAWQLSGGLAALLSALLAEDQKHPLKEAVNHARVFLSVPAYKRLLLLDNFGRDKEQFNLFLEAMDKILIFLHRNSVENNKEKQAVKLLHSRKTLLECRVALDLNCNPKIVTLKLVQGLRV